MTTSGWVIGQGSIEKVVPMFNAYAKNRVDKAIGILGSSIQGFHPLLGDSDYFQKFDKNAVKVLTDNKQIINFSPSIQFARKQIYENLDFLENLRSGSGPLFIDENFLESQPQSEEEFNAAIELIKISCPWIFEIFKNIVVEICPLSSKYRERTDIGMTDYHLVGSIFCSLKPKPFNIVYLAISLAHEIGHNVLMIYQKGADPISHNSYGKYVYSGVRKTERPVFASLHAAVALGYMISISRSLIASGLLKLDELEFVKIKLKDYEESLGKGLIALEKVEFEQLGKFVVADLYRLLKD